MYGYTHYAASRSVKQGGGVILYLNSLFKSKLIFMSQPHGLLEYLAVKVFAESPFIFILVYGPPDTSGQELAPFLDQISCLHVHGKIVLMGDLNLLNICWQNAAHTPQDNLHNMFHDFCLLHHLYQFVDVPTREVNILDLVLCNDICFVANVSVVMPISTSDHNCVEFSLKIVRPYKLYNTKERHHDFARADYAQINAELMQINWDIIFGSGIDVNDYWLNFYCVVSSLISKYVPFKCIGRGAKKAHLPRCIRIAIKKKRAVWKRARRTGDPNTIRKFKRCSVKVHRMLKAYKLQRDQASLTNVTLKNFYQVVSRRLYPQQDDLPLCDGVGNPLTSDEDKANACSEVFLSNFRKDPGGSVAVTF